MKFTIDKRILTEAVGNLQRAVSTKTSIPALEGILIRTDVEKIILSAYDLEIGMQTELPAVISAPGAIILTARLFSEIVRKSPADDVTVESDDRNTATITSGVSCFTIIGMNAAEFPEFPKITDTDTLRLPANVLKSMIRQTLFAIADSNAKPIHQGSLFKIEDNMLDVVSVDGYRLALRREAIRFDGSLDFVVPGKTLSEVLKLLRDDDGEVEICPSRRHILFKIDNYTVLSALLEGEFLDYRAALPKDKKTEVTVSTRTLIDSVERVSLLITDRLKSPAVFSTRTPSSCSAPRRWAARTTRSRRKSPATRSRSASTTSICSTRSARPNATKCGWSSAGRSARCSSCRRRATASRSSSCRSACAARFKPTECFTQCPRAAHSSVKHKIG